MNLTMIERTQKLKLMVFDVDGVLTDGRIYFSEEGIEIKAFHSLDGHGLKMLRSSGVEVAIMSGRQSKAVDMRAQSLGIQYVYQGVEDKLPVLLELFAKLGITGDQAGFMGDDIVDISSMRRCGLSVAVPNSPLLVRENAHYVTQLAGGHGAVRELCEFIMQIQGTFDRQIARYLA